MLRGLFARRADRESGETAGPSRDDAERIKGWVRAILDLPADSELTVSEIVCTDPSCPGTETVVLVMVPGRRTWAIKLAAAASAVTEQDVRSALVEAIGGDR